MDSVTAFVKKSHIIIKNTNEYSSFFIFDNAEKKKTLLEVVAAVVAVSKTKYSF